MRLLLMCGSEVSQGVEVMEGDRRKTEESRREESAVKMLCCKLETFCMNQNWFSAWKETSYLTFLLPQKYMQRYCFKCRKDLSLHQLCVICAQEFVLLFCEQQTLFWLYRSNDFRALSHSWNIVVAISTICYVKGLS